MVPGRWAGGFQAWDDDGVYLATGRGVEFGRLLKVPARRPAGADGGLAAAGRAPGPRRVRDGTVDRGDGAAARVAGHPRDAVGRPRARAEQPGGGRGPHGGVDGRDAQRPAALARRARRGRDHRRPVPGPRPPAPRDRHRAPDPYADAALRRRGRAGRVARGPRRRRPVDAGLDAGRRGRAGLVARERGRPAARGGPDRRPRVGRRHPVGEHAALGAARGDRSRVRSSSTRCAPTRRWTARPSSPSTSSRASRARW